MGIETVPKEIARNYHSLTLAFLGDAVYNFLVCQKLVAAEGIPYKKLHGRSVEKVRASYQAAGARLLESRELLSAEETEVMRRGRNAKSPVPKSASVGDYRLATGLEALFGYLELIGENERVRELFEVVYHND
jgi:ribonuclease-3 family protein